MGMLLYSKEAFGNCQIRVVFRGKETKSNAGVFMRIDDGVLKIAERSEVRKKQSTEEENIESEKELGPWYPVHRGFEVQISEIGDEQHRTGSIYSLAKEESFRMVGGFMTHTVMCGSGVQIAFARSV